MNERVEEQKEFARDAGGRKMLERNLSLQDRFSPRFPGRLARKQTQQGAIAKVNDVVVDFWFKTER